MTVSPHFTPAKGPDLPTPDRLLGRVDAQLKAEAQQNRGQVEQAVRGPIPARSGRTRATTRATVRSARLGYTVTVENRERAHVVRFLQGGTGQRGGFGRIPKARRGIIRRGTQRVVPDGMGQRPQQVWSKGLKAASKVTGEMERQMRDAWQNATRGLGR